MAANESTGHSLFNLGWEIHMILIVPTVCEMTNFPKKILCTSRHERVSFLNVIVQLYSFRYVICIAVQLSRNFQVVSIMGSFNKSLRIATGSVSTNDLYNKPKKTVHPATYHADNIAKSNPLVKFPADPHYHSEVKEERKYSPWRKFHVNQTKYEPTFAFFKFHRSQECPYNFTICRRFVTAKS